MVATCIALAGMPERASVGDGQPDTTSPTAICEMGTVLPSGLLTRDEAEKHVGEYHDVPILVDVDLRDLAAV